MEKLNKNQEDLLTIIRNQPYFNVVAGKEENYKVMYNQRKMALRLEESGYLKCIDKKKRRYFEVTEKGNKYV